MTACTKHGMEPWEHSLVELPECYKFRQNFTAITESNWTEGGRRVRKIVFMLMDGKPLDTT